MSFSALQGPPLPVHREPKSLLMKLFDSVRKAISLSSKSDANHFPN